MLEARKLSVRIGPSRLLSEVDIALAPGSVTAVIGPNGAGKSTLLKALAGELAASGGEVLLGGINIRAMPPAVLAQHRAVLPQSVELAFSFTVAEVVRLGALPALSRVEARALVARAIEAVGLMGFEGRFVPLLSGGERQRTHLARVLVQLWSAPAGTTTTLLLDEPTASLDLEHQLMVLAIARQHAEAGGAVMAVLHDLNLAIMSADHLVALSRGRTIAAGPPGDILTDALIHDLYRVRLPVGVAPPGPFLLPQMARAGPPTPAV